MSGTRITEKTYCDADLIVVDVILPWTPVEDVDLHSEVKILSPPRSVFNYLI